jgi:hypothetical protein
VTSLADRASNFPEAWRPEAGDVIEGVVTEISSRDSEYGDPYQIVTVLDDDGTEFAVHCFHTMLRQEVERKQPKVDDRIAVAYHGLGEAKPGMQPPHRYRLIVERNDTASEPVPLEAAVEAQAGGFDDSIPF